ncbi:conjugal transfer protein TraD [Parashewanella spongiae]|uniref:Conjugal transfer protein TraD n=1 Tax=Parashewanella spongiae TaxID=342950 RepID=A0A3A6U3C2_9GAMM|nr:conjugal transfer protein TraD [Parashewanella spongiae]
MLNLNIPGNIVELTAKEAEELGAFEEDALTEDEALPANELEVEAESVSATKDED